MNYPQAMPRRRVYVQPVKRGPGVVGIAFGVLLGIGLAAGLAIGGWFLLNKTSADTAYVVISDDEGQQWLGQDVRSKRALPVYATAAEAEEEAGALWNLQYFIWMKEPAVYEVELTRGWDQDTWIHQETGVRCLDQCRVVRRVKKLSR